MSTVYPRGKVVVVAEILIMSAIIARLNKNLDNKRGKTVSSEYSECNKSGKHTPKYEPKPISERWCSRVAT